MKQFIQEQSALDTFCQNVIDCEVEHIAVDVETEYVKVGEKHLSELELYGIGIYAKEGKKVFQAYFPTDRNLDFSKLRELIYAKRNIYHNSKFDLTILEANGFDISKIEFDDTFVMSWICDENRQRHGLKYLAEKVLKKQGITKLKDVGERPEPEDFGMFTGSPEHQKETAEKLEKWRNEMASYCMDDVEYTFKLFFIFREQMKKEETWKAYWKICIPFSEVLRKMENTGIFIDVDYIRGLELKAARKLAKLEKVIYQEAGEEFNINSTKQLREVFTRLKIRVPDQYKTKSGEVSTNKQVLRYLATKMQVGLAQALLEYREFSTLKKTFLSSLPTKVLRNRLHCQWRLGGTVTGRLASGQPNLQNIPSREDEFNIRLAFKPSPGHKFVIADYSQLELRIMAFWAQEESLKKIYEEGGDIHQATADKMGCSRKVAKNINFGLNYGQSYMGLAEGCQITEDEAKTFISNYFKTFPQVKDFHDRQKEMVKKKKYIQTLFKRRRRFPTYGKLPIEAGKTKHDYPSGFLSKELRKNNNRALRQAVNSTIQGSAADLMMKAMVDMARAIEPYGAQIILQIHDEVVVEVKDEYAEQVMHIVQKCMEDALDLGIPLLADPKICNVWEK